MDSRFASASASLNAVIAPFLTALNQSQSQIQSQSQSRDQGPGPVAPDRAQSAVAALQSLEDLSVSMELMARRAAQVNALYTYLAAGCADTGTGPPTQCAVLLATARDAVEKAAALVPAAEQRYGLFAAGPERMWGWGRGVNPTAYGFGHLWPAHNLYYWRRDQHIVEQRISNPCAFNDRNPLDIYSGSGTSNLTHALLKLAREALKNVTGVDDLSDCLGQPDAPWFPRA